NSEAEVHHFIGKDIAYFHTLFWPALLEAADFRKPTAVNCHGFLTVNGAKMSKSRGTFIQAESYLKYLNPEYLRYYFASKLSNGVDDIDLSLEDFVARVNSDVVGKVVNIAARCSAFINKRFDNALSDLTDPALYQEFSAAAERIAELYESRRYNQAIREIMALADKANLYIDEYKPWVLAKSDETLPQVQAICTQGLNMFRALMVYLKPVMPQLVADAEAFLNAGALTWQSVATPLVNHRVNNFNPLMTRIDPKQIEAMIEDNKKAMPQTNTADAQPKPATQLEAVPLAPTISIDDFSKLDLRIAKIIKAAAVDGADKLVQLTLDIGGETRNVFAGIKAAYQPEDLEGRLTVMVANLAPRKMRFGVSEGMVLAAGSADGKALFLLNPDTGAQPGMRVK
ncbi:MAG: methionine--tRNA ligase subunit beta, partial [Thiotrichaceae bacterium]